MVNPNGPCCRLCGNAELAVIPKNFLRCSRCDLRQKSEELLLSLKDEKARYLLHENNPEDLGYQEYLNSTLNFSRPQKTDTVLDYGCGPTKGVENLLKNEVQKVISFDPIFYPIDLNLSENVDLVICSESAEHFYSPKQEFERIFSLLKPKGRLLLRTEIYQPQVDFTNWYYINDPTHVALFSLRTLEFLARQYDRKVLKTDGLRLTLIG